MASMRRSLAKSLSRFSRRKSKEIAVKEIVDFRGISLHKLQEICAAVASQELAPEVRLFRLTGELAGRSDIPIGTSIKLLQELDSGLAQGLLPYSAEVIEFCPGQNTVEKLREEWSTEDIAEHVILALTQDLESGNQIYLATVEDSSAVGQPYQGTFVSHARSSCFAELVYSLSSHLGSKNDGEIDGQYVWIDVFCTNQVIFCQQGLSEQQELSFFQALTQLITNFENVSIFFDHWNSPTPLLRTWCVWEVFTSLQYGRSLQAIFADGQEEDFKEVLMRDPDEISAVSSFRLDVQQSHCSLARDTFSLRNAFNRTIQGNYAAINVKINKQIGIWVMQMALQTIEHARSGSDPLELAKVLSQTASVMDKCGRYTEALLYYEEALTIQRECLGDFTADVATTLNNLACVYEEQGRYEDALNNYAEVLHILGDLLETEHPYIATTLSNIAMIHRIQGEYDDSLRYYLQALDIRRKSLGHRDPDVANTLNDIGCVEFAQQHYREALEHFQQAAEIKQEALGKSHASFQTSQAWIDACKEHISE